MGCIFSLHSPFFDLPLDAERKKSRFANVVFKRRTDEFVGPSSGQAITKKKTHIVKKKILKTKICEKTLQKNTFEKAILHLVISGVGVV